MSIKVQTKVRHVPSGRIGVVCPDLVNCCTPEETPVVYEGETGFLGTETVELEILGPENAVPDPQRCGAGQGENCCIFLTCGPNGFCCERFSSLRYDLIFKTMSAKRQPVEMYPGCMFKELAA